MDVHALLNQVRTGQITVEEAEEQLKNLPYEDLGCAKIDHHRGLRSGFGEVIYCAGKSEEQLQRIYGSFAARRENVLGTRATRKQYEAVAKEILGPELLYDPMSRVLCLCYARPELRGNIAVCTAGTSDIPVAEEAARVAEYFGSRVERIYDVGVAGIHRLFSKMEQIRKANCVVAVAGMEGALPGVLAGLVDKPVIAVPTSVGYGANFGGISALLTMLNSCAEGIAVVNIDNGFGAGYLATQINRMAWREES
ncbi:MAG: nickel pincer cofactor biosynthesis protein LarB [Lachnospiraceae bacterium]|nr:nickel pincer cofactor biosynthesis protein LarB [Lachnospiraceae bacterium]MCI9133429.1 nickel pincer cofactor biosynthesis protein LarB [Lachnospiraceae bacterium]